eukprot:4634146-Pyramimonas_sp.AAC.1
MPAGRRLPLPWSRRPRSWPRRRCGIVRQLTGPHQKRCASQTLAVAVDIPRAPVGEDVDLLERRLEVVGLGQ